MGLLFRSPRTLSPPRSWLKGRRNPSLRNNFKWQWLETARIATPSQKLDPDEFSGEP
jgi:hypothetical protein